MLGLRKFVAPEFVFGIGARHLAGRYAANFGARKVLIVSDPGVVAAGWVGEVQASLDEARIGHALFTGVSPNPRVDEVAEGADQYRADGCDVIVAVGGGSPMDCAKGIGIVSTNGGSVLKYEGIDNVDAPGPPLICVPTTAGTSADVSQFAVITNPADRVKIAIISKTAVPDVALIDPETTTTMPPYLTVCTGLDALVHAVEAFVSVASSPFIDMHALEAMRLIKANLMAARERPGDLKAREAMMQASLHAGLAFSNASLGATHAMSHSLGGLLDLPHGESNVLLLEHVVAFNYDCAPERFDRIGEALGLRLGGLTTPGKRNAIFREISALRRRAGVDGSLAQRGVSLGDIPQLADNATRDACMVTNPRRPTKRDVEVLYEEAL